MNVIEPSNVLGYKVSVPFPVATRLVQSHTKFRAFSDEAIRDPVTLALARKVHHVGRGRHGSRQISRASCAVSRPKQEGRAVSAEVSLNKGEPALPYSRLSLATKYLELTDRAWPPGHCRALLDVTLSLRAPSASLRTGSNSCEALPCRDRPTHEHQSGTPLFPTAPSICLGRSEQRNAGWQLLSLDCGKNGIEQALGTGRDGT